MYDPATPRRRYDYVRAAPGLRARVLAYYGGTPPACLWCGSTTKLELDHIENDGAEHRRDLRALHLTLEEWLIAEDFPADIVQVLCQRCHHTKTRLAQRRTTKTAEEEEEAPMPARKGAVTAHITLSPEAQAQLERLTAQTPHTTKSQVVEGLILRTLTDPSGDAASTLADRLHTIEQRLAPVPDLLATSLAQMTTTADRVTTALTTLHQETQAPLDQRLESLERLLKAAFPSLSEQARHRQQAPPRGLRALWLTAVRAWRSGGAT